MKVLELFCGTKSFSKVASEFGHDYFTVDYNSKFKPDMCCNIMELRKNDLPKEFRKPDVVWASPPCETFSM